MISMCHFSWMFLFGFIVVFSSDVVTLISRLANIPESTDESFKVLQEYAKEMEEMDSADVAYEIDGPDGTKIPIKTRNFLNSDLKGIKEMLNTFLYDSKWWILIFVYDMDKKTLHHYHTEEMTEIWDLTLYTRLTKVGIDSLPQDVKLWHDWLVQWGVDTPFVIGATPFWLRNQLADQTQSIYNALQSKNMQQQQHWQNKIKNGANFNKNRTFDVENESATLAHVCDYLEHPFKDRGLYGLDFIGLQVLHYLTTGLPTMITRVTYINLCGVDMGDDARYCVHATVTAFDNSVSFFKDSFNLWHVGNADGKSSIVTSHETRNDKKRKINKNRSKNSKSTITSNYSNVANKHNKRPRQNSNNSNNNNNSNSSDNAKSKRMRNYWKVKTSGGKAKRLVRPGLKMVTSVRPAIDIIENKNRQLWFRMNMVMGVVSIRNYVEILVTLQKYQFDNLDASFFNEEKYILTVNDSNLQLHDQNSDNNSNNQKSKRKTKQKAKNRNSNKTNNSNDNKSETFNQFSMKQWHPALDTLSGLDLLIRMEDNGRQLSLIWSKPWNVYVCFAFSLLHLRVCFFCGKRLICCSLCFIRVGRMFDQ